MIFGDSMGRNGVSFPIAKRGKFCGELGKWTALIYVAKLVILLQSVILLTVNRV